MGVPKYRIWHHCRYLFVSLSSPLMYNLSSSTPLPPSCQVFQQGHAWYNTAWVLLATLTLFRIPFAHCLNRSSYNYSDTNTGVWLKGPCGMLSWFISRLPLSSYHVHSPTSGCTISLIFLAISLFTNSFTFGAGAQPIPRPLHAHVKTSRMLV